MPGGKAVLVESPPASAMLQNLADYACDIQSTYPLWTTARVLEKIRGSVELGEFGDMHGLLYPSTGVVGIAPDSPEPKERTLSQVSVHPGYPMHTTPMPSVPATSVVPTVPRTFAAGTVNPSTLTVTDPFSYTEAWHRTGSPGGYVDSDGSQSSFPDPDLESHHYNYVSFLGLLPELTPQEPQDAYVVGHPSMAYPFAREVYLHRAGFDIWERQ